MHISSYSRLFKVLNNIVQYVCAVVAPIASSRAKTTCRIIKDDIP